MDILLIHGNYPGQFRLRPLLCRIRISSILTEREDAEKEAFDGLYIKKFKAHRSPGKDIIII